MPICDERIGRSGKHPQGDQEENSLIQRELRGLTVEAWMLFDRTNSGPPITTRDLDRFLGNLQERIRVITPLVRK
jgi:hypothetical protein